MRRNITFATANSFWIDIDTSKYGINQYNATTGAWVAKTPTVEVNATASAAHAAGAGGYSIVASVVNGAFLVVVHLDQDGDASLEYFYGVGGAWEELDSDGNLSNGDTVTWAPHYSAPSTPGNNDVWIKTTSPGNGIDLKLYKHTGTGSWNLTTVQGGTSALSAGKSTSIGDFVPQDGSSVTVLTSSSAVEGNFLLDVDANTKALIIIQQVDSAGAPEAISGLTAKLGQTTTPTAAAAADTYWFDDTLTNLDLYNVNGSNYTRIADANIAYQTSAPTSTSAGDIWVDTTSAGYGQANERSYPKIYKRNAGNSAWILHDNTDQSTSNGVLFADITDTADDNSDGGNATEITGAPSAAMYPDGMVVVNMAQSRNTVRQYNSTATAWRNGASNHADGSGRFGRYAQRGVVATKMQAVAAGTDLRDPGNRFSLIAAPGYPELIDEMVTLNSDRGETAFIIVDTPMRKNATDVISWVKNTASASENGEDGLVTNNTYSAVYYPSGQTTEPAGGETVTVPPSHMALYTFAYNDNISFQWFAPAGTTRGVVQNASAVGHITTEGEFKAITLSQGQRDAMYTAKLNPITTFPGQGTIIFGQKTLHTTTSALDRVNVARLVAYLRDRFDELARPFLFEINDDQTRARAKIAFERFLADILSRRGLNDFAVVCDTSNNTPARIDRNEFYVDVAIEPSKAAEFIYIPIRLVNTGALSTTN